MSKKVITLTEKRFFEWHEDDKSVTLRNMSGSYGGGSEVFIIYSTRKPSDRSAQQITNGYSNNRSETES